MTVEQLIELLERECPQALVIVTPDPCNMWRAPYLHRANEKREVVSVYSHAGNGRVYIQADGLDC